MAGPLWAPVVIPIDPPPDPFSALAAISALPSVALLESARENDGLGRFTFLTADPVEMLEGSAADWPSIRDRVRATISPTGHDLGELPPFQGGWIGWFGYELGSALDRMPARASDNGIPVLSLALHDWVIAWDHQRAAAWLISTGLDADGSRDPVRAKERAERVLSVLSNHVRVRVNIPRSAPHTRATTPTSNSGEFASAPVGLAGDFSPDEYRAAVARVVEYILDGDILQANLAQRFTAPFAGDALELYAVVRSLTPAPMGAFISRNGTEILSASPERFLRFTPGTRMVETRPIKGTRPRGSEAEDDARLAAELMASEKDRAENVMIVDLLRNDLSRVCEPGSVRTPVLCRLESHPTVHHLVSIVEGRLRKDCDGLDLLAAAFPGGSVTGAPKLRAVAVLAELEPVARGVYTGAIGWIGLDGGIDTNLAIRTVTLRDGRASVYAGGGITAQSIPELEYQETLDKARALIAALAGVK